MRACVGAVGDDSDCDAGVMGGDEEPKRAGDKVEEGAFVGVLWRTFSAHFARSWLLPMQLSTRGGCARLQVIIAGDVIDAATAHAWGIVQYLCTPPGSGDSSSGRGGGGDSGSGGGVAAPAPKAGVASPAQSALDTALNLAKRILRQSPAAVEVAKHTIDRAGAGAGGQGSSLYRERVGEGALYQLKHVPNATIVGTAVVSFVLPPVTRAAAIQSLSFASSFAAAVARTAEEAVRGALATGHAVPPELVSSAAAGRQTGYVTLHVCRRVWRRVSGEHGGRIRVSTRATARAELEDALVRQLRLPPGVSLRAVVTTAVAHRSGGDSDHDDDEDADADDSDDDEEAEETEEQEDVSLAAIQAAAVWCGHPGHSDRFAVVLTVSPATGEVLPLGSDGDNGVGTSVRVNVAALVLWRRSHDSALGGLPSATGGQLHTPVRGRHVTRTLQICMPLSALSRGVATKSSCTCHR